MNINRKYELCKLCFGSGALKLGKAGRVELTLFCGICDILSGNCYISARIITYRGKNHYGSDRIIAIQTREGKLGLLLKLIVSSTQNEKKMMILP